MTSRDWAVWQLDWPTLWVYAIGLQFGLLEVLTSGVSPFESWRGQMVTDHLRVVFGGAPLLWFVGFGLWLWVGIHLLAPTLEAWIIRRTG